MISCRRRLAVFLLALLLGLSGDLSAIDIDRFDVTIRLHTDSTFLVTEVIAVDFGDLQRHGIFRTIPVDYSRPDSLAGVPLTTRYSIRLQVLNVTDDEGRPHLFTVRNEGRNLFIRIGDPDRMVTGKITYVITYRVERAINRFQNHDELYWNVTGTEWDWPIRQASVRVAFPTELAADRVLHKTFTGRWGAKTTHAMERIADGLYQAEVRDLEPSEGLTFVLGFPKGVLEPPSTWRELWWKLSDNILFFLAALAPVLSFTVLFFFYLGTGRDPGGRTPIVVQYEPPAELSPAEVGSLMDETIDTPDIVSTVLDLAVRGYLKVHQVETTRFLFLSSKDYRFEKLKAADQALSPHEEKFFTALFDASDSVMLSSLKNKFYTSIPGIRKAIAQQMLAKNLFPRDPAHVRAFFWGVGIVAAVVPIGLGVLIHKTGLVRVTAPPAAAAFALFALASMAVSWLIIWFFGKAMPSKTPKGAQLARHCLGFKEFVMRVEKDRIERMAKDDPTLFERFLPYAVVLGVADEWAERFEGLLTQPPSWYGSSSFRDGSFYPRLLVNDLGQSMHSMGSTLTSHPSSSGGSGSSGFSGGGGSSGGGFGGGGGGSW